ncbi:serine kinase [bacterium]|nr:serine kinase [bacterium]MBU1599648.1 serine kinase [bacterium]
MKLKEIVEKLGLEVKSAPAQLDNEVSGGYVSDLLSDVLAHSKVGNIWITLQTHQNIVAVATLKELSGIIITNNRQVEEETQRKAEEERIPILVTNASSFEIVGRLYQSGITGEESI